MSEHASLPPLGPAGLARWAWRQFTSMRTALILLFLLALASIPGSILPQRGTNEIAVREWIEQRPTLGAFLDAIGMFDVFASPWFAAVYLLLFISLVGCVLPRMRQLWRAWRAVPPPAPRRMGRIAGTQTAVVDEAPQAVIEAMAERLAGERWRVRIGEDASGTWVSAEKGYLKEAGNLFFHIALVAILVAVGVGSVFGWHGSVIVRVGQGFANTITQYDDWAGGRFVTATDLPPFSFTLDSFQAEFEREGAQRGEPRVFDARVTYRADPAAAPQQASIQVNEPLDVGAGTVYLVGHGFAPHFTLTDRRGQTVFEDAVVFLPQDGNFSSTGVLKAPDAQPQMGFEGVFLPTVQITESGDAVSSFPAPDDPAVLLVGWEGDLGLDDGVPQSIYALETDGLERFGVEGLRPGESWVLPDGRGTLTFTGYERWASFRVAHDPGQGWALLAAVLAMLGLTISVAVQRRRLWVKASLPTEGEAAGRTVVEIGGLTRTASLDEEPTGALADDIEACLGHLTRSGASR